MGENIVYKILKNHIIEGKLEVGKPIGLKIDQTLTQDSTGTMVYLQLEAMRIDKVKTKRSVAFIDHNMLQQGFENADDHKFIQTVAEKHGIYFSKPGNGVCHQVFLERFTVPGDTLIGSDSHTPTAGGVGMLAMGAGGLDVALAMAGGAYYINTPKVCKINLIGKLKPMVTGKDVILEVLRKLTVKGGVARIFEYGGEGVKNLSVPQRATITNMGAELGATTSIFPSDERTLEFFKAHGREKDFILGPLTISTLLPSCAGFTIIESSIINSFGISIFKSTIVSLGSVKTPAIADTAAVSGLTRYTFADKVPLLP